jgi:hypothetical protein
MSPWVLRGPIDFSAALRFVSAQGCRCGVSVNPERLALTGIIGAQAVKAG